jgi:hypothetical protein
MIILRAIMTQVDRGRLNGKGVVSTLQGLQKDNAPDDNAANA